MPSYYNEFDGYAAQWLRNLIAAGHLAPGDVDERSIADVQPDDLRGYTQCHFFAGIGVWGHALRSIGWADDRPIWTGSCPCQPFSAAGKQKGIADERHLWPEWYRLVEKCRPAIVVGEQVASALGWLDIVQNDLENAGYAVGAADLCAAGFPVAGWHESPQHEWLLRAIRHCPDSVVAEQLLDFAAFAIGNLGAHDGDHIRQRLYFVGLANGSANGRCEERADSRRGGAGNGTQGRAARHGASCDTGRLEHGEQPGLERHTGNGGRGDEPRRFDPDTGRPTAETSAAIGVEHASGGRRERGQASAPGYEHDGATPVGPESQHGAGVASAYRVSQQGSDGRARADAVDGERGTADWLFCRDGKWRPVGPGAFPLANAPAARVGRLRAYGNALDGETVKAFLRVVADLAP